MMREKRRYLEFSVVSDRKFAKEEAKHMLYEAVFSLIGEEGASKAAVQLKAFETQKQLLLVKCALASQNPVISALALKTSFKGEKVSLHFQKIYGTLEKAKAEFPSLKDEKF
ncbi:hypothetical protein HY989_01615 [Candidatus Micrarchaeota archaeon]|nr:hypothetical protein [Candidatus Micrarchaeota archaeon]